MAKQRKEATLEQIANEMNEVMAYGCNADGVLEDPNEQIDTELSQKALLKVITDRAKEDLRVADEGSFSPEVWDWFIKNDLVPDEKGDTDMDNGGAPSDDQEAEDEDDDNASEGDDDSEPDENDEDDGKQSPRKIPPAKVKREANPDRPKNEQKGSSKAQKAETRTNTRADNKKADEGKERAANPESTKKNKRGGTRPAAMAKGGNEQFAKELVEDGCDFDEFHKEFINLYKKCKPDADKKFILSRAKIYWNIAHKQLGKSTPPTSSDADTSGKSGKQNKRPDNKHDDDDTGRSQRRGRR